MLRFPYKEQIALGTIKATPRWRRTLFTGDDSDWGRLGQIVASSLGMAHGRDETEGKRLCGSCN
jgi:hypothetical protein